MKRMEWENAFSPVPGAVHLRLEKALEEKNMKVEHAKRPAATAVLVIALLLGLMGIAYATTMTGILDYLVRGEENASEKLKESVQAVEAAGYDDHIKIDLTGAIFDGDRLALSFLAKNEKPEDMALITLDTVTMNGEWVPINFQSFQETWVPNVFMQDVLPVVRNPVSGGMQSGILSGEYTGQVQVEATFVISRPEKELVVVDPWMWYDLETVIPQEEWRKETADRKASILQTGMEIADVFAMEAEVWLQDGYTPVNAEGRFLLDMAADSHLIPLYAGEGYGERPAFSNVTNRPGQMKETGRITLFFTLDADAAKANRMDLQLPDVALETGTVHFDKVLITPFSTLVNLRIYPYENTDEALDKLSKCYLLPYLTDAAGEEIQWLDMENEGFSGICTDEDGNRYFAIEYTQGGMNEMPDTLGFSFGRFGNSNDAEIQRLQQEFMEKVIIPLK